MEVFPSPNDQAHDEGESSDASINWTVRGVLPLVVAATNAAVGAVASAGSVVVRNRIVITNNPRHRAFMEQSHPGTRLRL